jgi:hypothetical protein
MTLPSPVNPLELVSLGYFPCNIQMYYTVIAHIKKFLVETPKHDHPAQTPLLVLNKKQTNHAAIHHGDGLARIHGGIHHREPLAGLRPSMSPCVHNCNYHFTNG